MLCARWAQPPAAQAQFVRPQRSRSGHTVLGKLLRYAAPVMVLAASFGAIVAALSLGPTYVGAGLYVLGVAFQVIAVGAISGWLLSAETPAGEHALWTHLRHSWLLWLAALVMAVAADVGHGRALGWYLALVPASGFATNLGVVVAYRRRYRGVAA